MGKKDPPVYPRRWVQTGIVGVIILVLAVLLLIVIGAGGYFFFFNERAQLERAIKPDTSTEESIKDKVVPRTEIKESGLNLEVVIEPSDNNVISDVVTITATQVVEEAEGVGFFISVTRESLNEGGMDSIGTDSSSEGGWSNTFNTEEFENGKYYLNVVVWGERGEGPPLGAAQIPVEIRN